MPTTAELRARRKKTHFSFGKGRTTNKSQQEMHEKEAERRRKDMKTDALDRVFKPYGKAEKIEFAKQKAEENLRKDLQDPFKVRRLSKEFEAESKRQMDQLKMMVYK